MPVYPINRSTLENYLNVSIYDDQKELNSLQANLEKIQSPLPEPDCNKVWVNSNEMYEGALEMLKNTQEFGDTYFGLSCSLNIKFASIRKCKYMIIFDRSSIVKKFWQIMKEECEKDIDIKTIKSNIKNRIYATAMTPGFQNLDLKDEELLYFQTIVKAKRFAFLLLDLTNTESFVKLAQKTQKLHLRPDTIYFSNAISDCYSHGKWLDALKILCPDSKCFFVKSKRSEILDERKPDGKYKVLQTSTTVWSNEKI